LQKVNAADLFCHALAAQLLPTCRADADCGGLPVRCVGRAHDDSSVLGLCTDLTRVAGEGDQCTPSGTCGPGLVCAGLTMGDGWGGMCVASWMSGTYETEVPVPVVAAAGASVVSPVLVIGQASVPIDLEVSVALTGVDPRRIRLTLADPQGAEAVVWNGQGPEIPARMVALGQISRDDNINGRWTLTVTNLATGTSGVLQGWQLHLTSRWD
jgi:hypothetical protein